jgi:hypothetical protein
MAKRNLARTAIEGGRSGRNRWEEYYGTRAERRQTHAEMHRIKADPEYAYEFFVEPRYNEGRNFADKLNPIRRWLESQDGRYWDDVYSEICRRFPGRSLAGRHVLLHIKNFVVMSYETNQYRGYGTIYVNEDGIIKVQQRRRYTYLKDGYVEKVYESRARIESVIHWILDNGLHQELNHAMTHMHKTLITNTLRIEYPFIPGTGKKDYLHGVPIHETHSAGASPRVLEGKHDVADFLQDVIVGKRPNEKEYHEEWKGSLFNFIMRVRPDFNFGVYKYFGVHR